MNNTNNSDSRKLVNKSAAKRRKSNSSKPIAINEDNDDIKMNATNTTKKPRKKFNTNGKFKHFGKSALQTKDGKLVSLMEIRGEVHIMSHVQENALKIISMYQADLARRAKGADIIYEKKLNKKGQEVMVKQPYLSHIKYAPKKKGTGGGTGFTPIETCVFLGACYIVATYPAILGCNTKLGILSTANYHKGFGIYVMMMSKLMYGWKYPEFCRYRPVESWYKKLKQLMDKKRITPDACQCREIFSKWDEPQNVASSNSDALSQAAAQAKAPGSSQQSNSVPPPCSLPLKKRRPTQPKNELVKESLIVMGKMNKLLDGMNDKDDKKNDNNSDDDVLDLTGFADISTTTDNKPNIPQIPSLPVPILPPISSNNKNKAVESSEFDVNDITFYQYLTFLFNLNVDKDIDQTEIDEATGLLLKCWHQSRHRKHVLRLVKYIKSQNMSNQHQINIIKCDLSELLK